MLLQMVNFNIYHLRTLSISKELHVYLCEIRHFFYFEGSFPCTSYDIIALC